MRLMESKWAICPFYKGHTAQVIHCEGLVEGAATHLAFGYPADARDHRYRYCDRFGYGACPVAKMLEEKYG